MTTVKYYSQNLSTMNGWNFYSSECTFCLLFSLLL